MDQTIIRLEDVRKSYGTVEVLKGVSLSVEAGSFVAVTGKSGSGKSTLLALISGLEPPSEGRLFVDGREISEMDDESLSRLRRETVGIVFQGFHLIPSLTALENVVLPMAARRKRPSRAAWEEAHSLLAQVGMDRRAGHKPGALSGGEKQRVAIARALISRPKILLADEPTGNLDEATGEAVLDLLGTTCREQGTALLMVTHDTDISARADAVITIRDGRNYHA